MITGGSEEKPDDRTLAPVAGPGLLARYGDLVLLYAAPDGDDGRTMAVLDAIASAAGGDGRRLGRQLAGLLLSAQDADFPPLAAFGPVGDGVAVIVHGAAQVSVVTDDGELVLDGRDAVTWVDRRIPAPARVIRGALGTLDDGSLDPWSRLDAGVVRAGGFVFGPPSTVAAVPAVPAVPQPALVPRPVQAPPAVGPPPPAVGPPLAVGPPPAVLPPPPAVGPPPPASAPVSWAAPAAPPVSSAPPVPPAPPPLRPEPVAVEPAQVGPDRAGSTGNSPSEGPPVDSQPSMRTEPFRPFDDDSEVAPAPVPRPSAPTAPWGTVPPEPPPAPTPPNWPAPPPPAPFPAPSVAAPSVPAPSVAAPSVAAPSVAAPSVAAPPAPSSPAPSSPAPSSPAPSSPAPSSPAAPFPAPPASARPAPLPSLPDQPVPDPALHPSSAPPAGQSGGPFDPAAPFEAVLLIGEEAAPRPSENSGPLPPADVQPPPGPVPADGAEEADARPIVLGIYCKNDHFNDPRVPYCAVCGISMAQLTHVSRTGPRPPLGLLVLDDGATFRLDTDYVVGREPERDEAVLQSRARSLRIDDPKGVVSRIHARVELDGWDVTVIDLASANGTHIAPPNSESWTRLEPHRRVVLTPGTRVVFGRRGFRYESHRNP